MTRKEKRRALKFGVRTRLIPHIQSLGFERPHTKVNRPRWPEFTPETDFGRTRGATTDFLDIQWERYGSAKFVMNFSFGPTAALHHSWEQQLQDFSDLHRLRSGYYGLTWGLLGFGGVWFGAGQTPEAAIDLAMQRVSELDRALQGDAGALAVLVERGFPERGGPGGWWLRHVNTDVPRAFFAFFELIDRLNGRSRP
ncbi:hypothetical protein [Phenylobacterium sp.]|jgi:hypothetical protein|uniref:hypothetical protein n=1 Tax=Phenylobacterium sp. TaxID=1871053 RepID=UPI002F94B566